LRSLHQLERAIKYIQDIKISTLENLYKMVWISRQPPEEENKVIASLFQQENIELS
jgi:hypothetical protein